MFTTPASTVIKFILILFGLLVVGLLVFAPRASAQTPEPSVGASISIEVDTVEEIHNVSFRFCIVGDDGPLSQCIGLNDGDDPYVFDDLAPDTYELAFQGRNGWRVDSFRCLPRSGANVYVVEDDAFARIVIHGDGDHYACKAVFERAPEPTATSTPTQTATAQPTATSTPAPAATAVPPIVFAPCPNGAFVNVTSGQQCPATPVPAAPVAPTLAPVVPATVIKPPSVGDAGLLEVQ